MAFLCDAVFTVLAIEELIYRADTYSNMYASSWGCSCLLALPCCLWRTLKRMCMGSTENWRPEPGKLQEDATTGGSTKNLQEGRIAEDLIILNTLRCCKAITADEYEFARKDILGHEAPGDDGDREDEDQMLKPATMPHLGQLAKTGATRTPVSIAMV